MKACCVKTMNFEIGDRPKAPHVTVEGGGLELTVTVHCPVCKTKTLVRTDGDSAKVDATPGAASTVAADGRPDAGH